MENKISWVISIFAIVIALIHVVFPKLTIDSITLTLIVIALLPWVAPLLKSIELPGGTKIELRDLEKVEEKAKEVGLIAKPKRDNRFLFQDISFEDPQLTLANLRIEIEKRLRKIAEQQQISVERKGIREILRILIDQRVLTQEETKVIYDLSNLLNKAVHSEIGKIDYNVVKWALEVGPEILEGLDTKIKQ